MTCTAGGNGVMSNEAFSRNRCPMGGTLGLVFDEAK